ncbi:MAG: GldG family protein [Byssovorax sp.]
MERKAKAATQTGIYLVVVGAILVIANVISYSAYKRVDMTKNERFSLSKGSAHLVRDGLDKELLAEVYVARGVPKNDAFIQDLTDLLGEYERASNGHFKYSVNEPKTDDEKKAAKELGCQEVAFGDMSRTGKEQALITKGFMCVAFKYGSEKEAIPVLSPEQTTGLEFWITNKIREIRDRADNKSQKIGIISGKDEIKLSEANLVAAQGRGAGPNMKGILEQALPFYKIEDVDLQNGDAEINKELIGLIITQPGKDFTEKELRRIDQFMMLGSKALVVYAGAVNVKANDASMKGTLDLHGLDKLLDGYGVEMKKEAILDWSRPAIFRLQTQGQGLLLPYPAVVEAQHDDRLDDDKDQILDTRFQGFFRMDQVAFPFTSPLVPHPDKQPEAKVKVVARTSPRATVVTTDPVDLKIGADLKPIGEQTQRAIAVTVEGKLKSAFGGKEGDGITTTAESKDDKGRILVISSSQFLANPLARAGNPPPMPPQMMMMGPMGGDEDLMMLSQPYAQQYLTWTILSFKNTLDWMGNDSDLIAVSAKLLAEGSLTYLDIEKPKDAPTDPDAAKKQAEERAAEVTKVQQRVQWTLILFPAALFALFGIFRWRMRENARANITLD